MEPNVAVEKDRPGPEATGARRSRRWLVAVVAAACALAAGGAAGTFGYLAPVQELLSSLRGAPQQSPPTFYALPEFRVPLGALSDFAVSAPASAGRHLQAVVQLEVAPDQLAHVQALEPRIVDTLITFLRVLNERDLAWAHGLERLKGQMLHRVREVTGRTAVQGVLITEFVIL